MASHVREKKREGKTGEEGRRCLPRFESFTCVLTTNQNKKRTKTALLLRLHEVARKKNSKTLPRVSPKPLVSRSGEERTCHSPV